MLIQSKLLSKVARPSSSLFARAVGDRAHLSTTTSAKNATGEQQWSGSMSFSSPESDFTAVNSIYKSKEAHSSIGDDSHRATTFAMTEKDWSGNLSFSSPESDFTSSQIFDEKVIFLDHLKDTPRHHDDMAYSLSFATADGDFCSPPFITMLDDRMKRQLQHVADSRREKLQLNSALPLRENDDEVRYSESISSSSQTSEVSELAPLPSSVADLEHISDDPRAIVVTEATVPFRIVTVNNAWESLCGYTASECRGETLGCIQGPDTDKSAITALMSQLLKGEEAGTVLTNYTKDGDKFHNRLRVGPLVNEHDQVTHFVGILKKLEESSEHFGSRKMTSSI